jgi:hypothetical protein
MSETLGVVVVRARAHPLENNDFGSVIGSAPGAVVTADECRRGPMPSKRAAGEVIQSLARLPAAAVGPPQELSLEAHHLRAGVGAHPEISQPRLLRQVHRVRRRLRNAVLFTRFRAITAMCGGGGIDSSDAACGTLLVTRHIGFRRIGPRSAAAHQWRCGGEKALLRRDQLWHDQLARLRVVRRKFVSGASTHLQAR